MNLEDRLHVLEGESQIAEPSLPKTQVKGWEPGVVWDGAQGTLVTPALESEPDMAIWQELIADWGLDPEKTEVVPGTVQVRGWDANVGGGDIRRLRYYRATLRTRVAEVDSFHMEELYKDAKKAKRPARIPDGDCTFVVALSDWQVGNRDGGGVKRQAEAIADLTVSIPERIADLRRMGYKIGHVLVAGMGDLGEGTCGHYPAQQFRIELDRRDQLKLVRRGLRDIIMATAKVAPRMSVVAVPGNHGENRQGVKGSSITSVHDNDDVAVFEQVAEILAMNPDAYGHIGWRLSRDEIALSVEASGHIISFTHGHVARMAGGGASNTLWKWWEGHAMGRAYPALAASHVLVSGHYHHFNFKEQESRSLIICPSLTPVGEYFQDSAGLRAKCGTVSFVLTEDEGWRELTLL